MNKKISVVIICCIHTPVWLMGETWHLYGENDFLNFFSIFVGAQRALLLGTVNVKGAVAPPLIPTSLWFGTISTVLILRSPFKPDFIDIMSKCTFNILFCKRQIINIYKMFEHNLYLFIYLSSPYRNVAEYVCRMRWVVYPFW